MLFATTSVVRKMAAWGFYHSASPWCAAILCVVHQIRRLADDSTMKMANKVKLRWLLLSNLLKLLLSNLLK